MGSRLIHLSAAMIGYLKTGVPLIEWDGSKLLLSNAGDDIGIYIIIPKIATYFGISLERAVTSFFLALLIIPMLCAVIGFCCVYKKTSERIVAIAAILLLTRFAYSIGDVYLGFSAAALMLIPWGIVIRESENFKTSTFFGVLSGMIAGFFHYIRSFSGIGTLLCILVLMISSRTHSKKNKMGFVLAILFGYFVPYYYFNAQYQEAKVYEREILNQTGSVAEKHPLWHPLYLGFGFLNLKNKRNIRYDDAFGLETARATNPSVVYCSNEYEEILRGEVLSIIKNEWAFLILTLFAKLGILIFYLLKFTNIGLLAAFFYRKSWVIDVAFFLGMGWNSIFPLLAIPLHEYSLGFIACATLWSITSINHALSELNLSNFQFIKEKQFSLK